MLLSSPLYFFFSFIGFVHILRRIFVPLSLANITSSLHHDLTWEYDWSTEKKLENDWFLFFLSFLIFLNTDRCCFLIKWLFSFYIWIDNEVDKLPSLLVYHVSLRVSVYFVSCLYYGLLLGDTYCFASRRSCSSKCW